MGNKKSKEATTKKQSGEDISKPSVIQPEAQSKKNQQEESKTNQIVKDQQEQSPASQTNSNISLDGDKYKIIQSVIVKLKEDQPQVWEKEHFIEFLKQLPFLKHIADKFTNYEFDWKTFLSEKNEFFEKITDNNLNDKNELLQMREFVKKYYDELVAGGSTMKKKNKKKHVSKANP